MRPAPSLIMRLIEVGRPRMSLLNATARRTDFDSDWGLALTLVYQKKVMSNTKWLNRFIHPELNYKAG